MRHNGAAPVQMLQLALRPHAHRIRTVRRGEKQYLAILVIVNRLGEKTTCQRVTMRSDATQRRTWSRLYELFFKNDLMFES